MHKAFPFKNRPVKAIVRIDGKQTNFVSLKIEQEYGQHHSFRLKLDYAVMGESFMKSSPTNQMELIGTKVVIDIQHGDDNARAYIFKGVITNLKVQKKDGRAQYLLLKGHSPTIMLDRGKRLDIYSDLTLRQIFKKLIEEVHYDYTPHLNDPTFKYNVEFAMQYNETDWEFLQRLAYQYGENLFFSGSEILFGKYEEWEPVELTYDVDILDLDFCTRLLPTHAQYYLYDPERNHTVVKRLPEDNENRGGNTDKMDMLSEERYGKKLAKRMFDANIDHPAELEELGRREKSRLAAQTVGVTGKANTYQTTIGRLIKIKMPEKFPNYVGTGTYRVIKSVHKFNENGVYSNKFEAVPAYLKTMPVKEPKVPVAHSVLAEVRDTKDPLGLGRVLVDFDFALQYNKFWLRVMTPNAGASQEVKENRGMMFIPEVGDQVMVGFEHGNPNRPFVMGSMFHKENTTGGGDNNGTKSIVTRSGIRITFNDNNRSLRIADPSGNRFTMDGNGNIAVSAPGTITFSAANINLNAGNSLNVTAQPQDDNGGEGTFSLSALKTIDIASQTDAISLSANETVSIESQSADITIKASTDTTINTADISIEASGAAKLSSSDTNIM